MAERVLIANRAEIAIRVIRASRDLGWDPIAIYGAGDENALHVRLSSEAYRLESDRPIPYLDAGAIIAIAKRASVRYVHPGYGFLAENAEFARACADAGLIFVGPSPEAIATMGDKVAARAAAVRAGVPILPGTSEPVADASAALAWASASQYPIALKAAAGGGGRGFRIAQGPNDLEAAFQSARGEAERAFGDGRLYAERYLSRSRHVEVQIFADRQGQVVAVGDRDCSIQRRHQKLIEESLAPNLSEETRKRMAAVSVDLAAAVGYVGAGTLEFLVEPDERFWFLEMNTRIQVEHTVTEEVFGVDLVREQLLVAAGERLSFTSLEPRGHSIQCRINAEDPGRQFAPTPGPISRFVPPLGPGIRVDTAIESGSVISDRYDSLIAKIVATGRDRNEAVDRMRRALAETVIDGSPSTLELHKAVMASDPYRRADLSTSFLNDCPQVIPPPVKTATSDEDDSPEWQEQIVEVNGRRFSVRIPDVGVVQSKSPARRKSSRRATIRGSAANGLPAFKSPLQGSVLRIARAVGDVVAEGEPVMVLEAMKMENEILAHRPGRLSEVVPVIGSAVRVGDHLFTIEDPDA